MPLFSVIVSIEGTGRRERDAANNSELLMPMSIVPAAQVTLLCRNSLRIIPSGCFFLSIIFVVLMLHESNCTAFCCDQ
jgi:hypothetical protein